MSKRTVWAGLGASFAICFVAAAARADDGDRPSRFGLLLSSGGGVAGVVHPGPLAGAIGFTDIGVELFGELRPWGLFLRGDFLSSGDAGRWTTYSFAAGTQYRLFGTVHTTALFLRGALVYEHMLGNNVGCPIPFFIPNSCNLLGAPPASFSTTGNLLGALAGVRLELPVPVIYLGLGASVVAAGDLGASIPAGTFELRFDLEAGFRDERTDRTATRTRNLDDRRRR
jgi:hypothetical protein